MMQYVIVGILVALAGAYFARRLLRKFHGTCNCGCGSVKKVKSTRATLTIGGREAAGR